MYYCVSDSIDIKTKSPSKAWYLLPIFFGILGGLVMYLVVKNDDKRMAKKGLILSVVLTIIGIIIAIVLNLLIMSSIGTSNMYPLNSMR